jgi:hypothetical protein
MRKIAVAAKAKAAAPAPEVKHEARAKARFTHDMEFAYGGDSPVVTSRKSKTPIRIDEFKSAPNLVLSDRDHAALGPLKQTFGKKPWARGNLDAGILNRLIRKGVVRHVMGEAADERATYKFVD